jgi:hypothetical protein
VLAFLSLAATSFVVLKTDLLRKFVDETGNYHLLPVPEWLWWAAIAINVIIYAKYVVPAVLDYAREQQEYERYAAIILRLCFVFYFIAVCYVLIDEILIDMGLVIPAAFVRVFLATGNNTLQILGLLTLLAHFGLMVARPIVAAVEFLLRRIAESPKGPLLATSGLVAGIAGVIKIVVG